MTQNSAVSVITLDDGRRYRVKVTRVGERLRLSMTSETLPPESRELLCDEDDLLLAEVNSLLRPAVGDEAEDVRNLVCHMLTCLDYFGGPQELR